MIVKLSCSFYQYINIVCPIKHWKLMHSENGIYLFEDTLSVHYYVKVKGIKELSDGF